MHSVKHIILVLWGYFPYVLTDMIDILLTCLHLFSSFVLFLISHTLCVCLPFSCLSKRSKLLSLAIFIRVASRKSTLLFCLCCRYTTFKTRWNDSTNMLVFTVVRALKQDAHCVTRVQYFALKYFVKSFFSGGKGLNSSGYVIRYCTALHFRLAPAHTISQWLRG